MWEGMSRVRKGKQPVTVVGSLLLLLPLLAACGISVSSPAPTATPTPPTTLNIVAGSEEQLILNRIVQPWCRTHNVTCNVALKGSVDQARLLQARNPNYDVYWFASTVFEQLGDKAHVLRDVKPIFITPLVYAGWRSEMQKLGFLGHSKVSIADILAAVESHRTRLWLTNPTQSNSGATVYLAFLNYFAGNGPGVALSMSQLDSQPVSTGITRFIAALDRTPPSTGTLMNDCIADPTRCRTLFTYEALVIEKNQQLEAQHHETLYAVYPKESLAIADAPMGFFRRPGAGAVRRESAFRRLQQYLLSPSTQQAVMRLGRRPASSFGLTIPHPDLSVFRPQWGITANLHQVPLTYPSAQVIEAALNRYQNTYRAPTDEIICADGSGSMGPNGGWRQLDQAVNTVLVQSNAGKYFLQAHPRDLTTVMVFANGIVGGPWTVAGNNAPQFTQLYENVHAYAPDHHSGTFMYDCLLKAAQAFAARRGEARHRLVVVMTDGHSDRQSEAQALSALQALNVPVVAIPFGSDADTSQLGAVAAATHGALVARSTDLVSALREAEGYR
jgi:Ca-activated chloride channel family protein